jgi:uncharacterized protein
MVHSARKARRPVGIPVGAFLLLTLGLTTLVLAISTIASRPALAGAALLSPGLVAYALTAARKGEVSSVAGTPPHPGILVSSLLAGPVIVAAVLGATGRSLAFSTPDSIALAWALSGAVSAELGWRGYLQPLLRVRFPALVAGLVTGLAWALWHVPLAVAGATPFPSTSPADFLAWALGSAIFLSAMLEVVPRSTWYPIAAQAGFTIYFVMSAVLPGPAASPWPFRLVTVVTTVIGLVLLVGLRRNTYRGRHLPSRP